MIILEELAGGLAADLRESRGMKQVLWHKPLWFQVVFDSDVKDVFS